MKTINKLFIAAGMLMAFQPSLFAQSATATGTANATVIKPITLTWEHPLNFGVFTQPTGTVTITEVADNTVINAGNENNINVPPTASNGNTTLVDNSAQFNTGNAGNPGPCVYYVTGQYGMTYNIIVPASSTMTGQNHGVVINVDGFQAFHNSNTAVTSSTLSNGTTPNGYDYFSIGATLHADNTDVADSYTGQFNCSVAYP